MNTRSKTKITEAVGLGEICYLCHGPIDPNFYGTFCQANERMCGVCLGYKCQNCDKTLAAILYKIYVLDGMPECQLWCKQCLKREALGDALKRAQ